MSNRNNVFYQLQRRFPELGISTANTNLLMQATGGVLNLDVLIAAVRKLGIYPEGTLARNTQLDDALKGFFAQRPDLSDCVANVHALLRAHEQVLGHTDFTVESLAMVGGEIEGQLVLSLQGQAQKRQAQRDLMLPELREKILSLYRNARGEVIGISPQNYTHLRKVLEAESYDQLQARIAKTEAEQAMRRMTRSQLKQLVREQNPEPVPDIYPRLPKIFWFPQAQSGTPITSDYLRHADGSTISFLRKRFGEKQLAERIAEGLNQE